jgi:hypothetical protein
MHITKQMPNISLSLSLMFHFFCNEIPLSCLFNIEQLNLCKTFSTIASVRSSGEILVSFDFSESTYRKITTTDETPPNTVNREWSGTVNLHAGRPAIAGATQNEETAVFLILCADIIGR